MSGAPGRETDHEIACPLITSHNITRLIAGAQIKYFIIVVVNCYCCLQTLVTIWVNPDPSLSQPHAARKGILLLFDKSI